MIQPKSSDTPPPGDKLTTGQSLIVFVSNCPWSSIKKCSKPAGSWPQDSSENIQMVPTLCQSAI